MSRILMTKTKLKIKYLSSLLVFFILPMIAIPVSADTIPVIPIDTGSQFFTPTVIGNNSVYIVPSGYSNSGIIYHGNSTITNPSSDYTALSGDTLASTNQGGYTTNGALPNTLINTASTGRTSNGAPNYFLPTDSIPVFVNMSEKNVYLSQQNSVSFSVHMGHSSTIFFNNTLTYYLLLNTTTPFFLDVELFNPGASINLNLSQTLFPSDSSYNVSKKWTIPIIPMADGQQTIKISDNGVNQNSLVTFTPLPFDINTFGKTQVDEGQYYSDQVKQGSCVDLQKSTDFDTTLKSLDLKFFQFPVQADNTYQIYFYKNGITDYSGSTGFLYCPGGSLNAARLDPSVNYNYVGGSITNTNTGLIVNAKSNGYINISLIATGYVQQDFGFFFQKNNQMKIPTQHDLKFNQPTNLMRSPDNFYTFTLQSPSLLAINYTATTTINPGFVWSTIDPTTNEFVPVITSNFNLERNNLLNDTTASARDLVLNTASNSGTDSSFNWVYLPAGEYRLDATGVNIDQHPDALFTFNLVEVQKPDSSNSINLNMQVNSIQAVELPSDPLFYNMVNASTSAHDNMSISYNWAVLGAYRFLNTVDSVGNTIQSGHYGQFTLGNRGAGVNWDAYNLNTTTFFHINVQTKNYYKPILLISPYQNVFWNGTLGTSVADFSSSITISSNTDTSNPTTDVNAQMSGTGTLISGSSAISTSTSVNVNDDVSTSRNQIYAFKVTTSKDSLYKIVVSIDGNHTVSGGINASVTDIYFHSANLIDTKTVNSGNLMGGTVIYSATNTTATYTSQFLSAETAGYLFIRVDRQSAIYNSTMSINITPVTVQQISIASLSNFAWNETISPLEVEDTTPLFNITNYHFPTGGDDLFIPLVIAGGIILVAAGGGAVVYVLRKKRADKHP